MVFLIVKISSYRWTCVHWKPFTKTIKQQQNYHYKATEKKRSNGIIICPSVEFGMIGGQFDWSASISTQSGDSHTFSTTTTKINYNPNWTTAVCAHCISLRCFFFCWFSSLVYHFIIFFVLLIY